VSKVEAQKLGEDAAQWINDLVTTLQKFRTDPVRLQALNDQVEGLLKYWPSCSSQIFDTYISYSVLKRIEKSMEERAKQSLRRRIVHQIRDAEELTLLRNELVSAYNRFMVICY
jgi:hypothetical protein